MNDIRACVHSMDEDWFKQVGVLHLSSLMTVVTLVLYCKKSSISPTRDGLHMMRPMLNV